LRKKKNDLSRLSQQSEHSRVNHRNKRQATRKEYRSGQQFSQKDSLSKEELRVKKIVRRVVIFFLILLVILIGGGFFYVKSALDPVNPQAKESISLEVPLGSSNAQIAKILQKKKIIKDAKIFTLFVRFNNYGNFKSGFYNLKPSLNLTEISECLKKGGTRLPQAPFYGKILIKEGQNIDQIAEDIEINVDSKKREHSLYKKKEFLSLIQDPNFFQSLQQKFPKLLSSVDKESNVRYKLEGYLYPATYSYGKHDTISKVVEKMVETMNSVLTPYYEQIKNKNLTVNQCLTLASLVEKEASLEDDRRKIAQVFFNRLQKDMPLKTDVSINYVLRQSKPSVSYSDLEVESPYNLYKNVGLGPGPVGSPSKMAIEAILDPKPTDDLYFLADSKTGKIYFSKTGEEHERLVEKHINNN
jgi:UPF0755 protein